MLCYKETKSVANLPATFPNMSDSTLKDRIKEMLVNNLMLKMRPEDISDDVVLFSPEGLALDSIDALELSVALEKTFGVKVANAEVARSAFVSVNTLAEFIEKNRPEAG